MTLDTWENEGGAIYRHMSQSEQLLVSALATAVPLWIMQLQKQPWDTIQNHLPELSQTIAEKGDIILFKSKHQGETAAAFNALAEAIAALSFVPGGIHVFGQHWENKHPELTYP